jgi:hypothetical protein
LSSPAAELKCDPKKPRSLASSRIALAGQPKGFEAIESDGLIFICAVYGAFSTVCGDGANRHYRGFHKKRQSATEPGVAGIRTATGTTHPSKFFELRLGANGVKEVARVPACRVRADQRLAT